MTEQDKAELADIEADHANVKLRRKRFFAKLRQRKHYCAKRAKDKS